jgi:hypothetical protein
MNPRCLADLLFDRNGALTAAVDRDASRLLWAKSAVDTYRSPVSQTMSTIIFPADSGLAAIFSAACRAAPADTPANTPSSRARRRAQAKASASLTAITSFSIGRFKTAGTNPTPIPGI